MINLKKSDIEASFDFDASVKAIRSCYIAASNKTVSLPPVGHIPFTSVNGDCHIKAGHIHEEPIFVIKIATGFYDNPKFVVDTTAFLHLQLLLLDYFARIPTNGVSLRFLTASIIFIPSS